MPTNSAGRISGSRSGWQEGSIDPNWYPQDGFKRRKTSYGAATTRARTAIYGQGAAQRRVPTTVYGATPEPRPTIWAAVVADCEWCDDPSRALVRPAPETGRFGVFREPPEAIRASLSRPPGYTPRACAEKVLGPLL